MHLLNRLGIVLLTLVLMCLSGNVQAQADKIVDGIGYGLSIINGGKSLAQGGYDKATGEQSQICWKASYGRGVGTVPERCKPGQDRIGLLCYDQCPAGMKRFGFDCHSTCPQGTRDDGLFCRATEYGRGVGYAWQIGDHAIAWDEQWWAGMTARCERDHGKGKCERGAGIVYPKCAPGFTAFGANICRPTRPNCQALGLNPGVDLSCAKKVAIGNPVPGVCRPGQVQDGGLCYAGCKAGYDGIGPVCWGKCDKDFPFECGAACATSEMACAMATTEQVVGVLSVAANIISTAMTVGGASASGPALKAALSTGLKEFVKTLGKDAAKKAVLTLAKDAAINIASSQVDNVVNMATGNDFDPTTLDPTGIAGMVKSFVKPVCGVSETYGGTTAKTWTQIAGKAEDIGIGGTGEGTLWHVGGNRVGGGYGIWRWNGTGWQGIPGGAMRIDVDGQGNAWVVNDTNTIYRWNGQGWAALDGSATDIGVGNDGTAWIIGTARVPGGHDIHRRSGNGWTRVDGGAVRIDVDPHGNAWVVNDTGAISRWNGRGWTRTPGSARDIGIGADGSVFIVGKDGSVQKWNGSGWDKRDGGLQEISVSPQGIPYGTNAGKAIWKGYR